ncbi:hypothetical protein NDU88_002560 [Pleurodeles waltl]|uniref:Uncharacterized protein n=1 Tax=Pleurodeles waltl TaxID=8319 RepID=A0AAV7QA96_PLEWA|nr:hypothetical protein NDU88_002560 [Pleurodeles waltl]
MQGGSINPPLIRADRTPVVSNLPAVGHRALVEDHIDEAGQLCSEGWAQGQSLGCWPGLVACQGHCGGAGPDAGLRWCGAWRGVGPGLLPVTPPPSLDLGWGQLA